MRLLDDAGGNAKHGGAMFAWCVFAVAGSAVKRTALRTLNDAYGIAKFCYNLFHCYHLTVLLPVPERVKIGVAG